MERSLFLYHYSPEALPENAKLKAKTWLTDQKGQAVSENIAANPDQTVYEYFVVIPEKAVEKKPVKRKSETNWYLTKEEVPASVRLLTSTTYREMLSLMTEGKYTS